MVTVLYTMKNPRQYTFMVGTSTDKRNLRYLTASSPMMLQINPGTFSNLRRIARSVVA